MPIDNLQPDPAKLKGQALYQALQSLNTSINLLVYCLNTMNQMTDGNNYATIESQFGVGSGNGQTAYNLVAGLVGNGGPLVGPAVAQALGRMG